MGVTQKQKTQKKKEGRDKNKDKKEKEREKERERKKRENKRALGLAGCVGLANRADERYIQASVQVTLEVRTMALSRALACWHPKAPQSHSLLCLVGLVPGSTCAPTFLVFMGSSTMESEEGRRP